MLSFRKPLLGLANVRWGGGLSAITLTDVSLTLGKDSRNLNAQQCTMWSLLVAEVMSCQGCLPPSLLVYVVADKYVI